MNDPLRARKRAVRLTPEARERVGEAMHAKWAAEPDAGKYTREARAHLLGVSVATAARILAGEGVDRPTLTHAFKNLDIPWEDSFCVSQSPDEGASESLPADTLDSKGRLPRVKMAILAAGTLTCLALLAVGYWLSTTWKPALSDALAKGSASYHRGDLEGAEQDVARAIDIARAHDAGRHLASALRVAADISAAKGNVEQAKAQYIEALSIRRAFKDGRSLPTILEALGELEAKTGDYANAQVLLEESLAEYDRYGDLVGVALAARNLGTLAFLRGHFDDADTWFAASLKAAHGQAKPDIEVDVKGRQALVLRDRGQLSEARALLQSCLSYWQDLGHPRWIAAIQLQLGTVELLDGQPSAARAILSASKASYRKVGDRSGEAEAQDLIDRIDPTT